MDRITAFGRQKDTIIAKDNYRDWITAEARQNGQDNSTG
jgi:hypothetical protein